MDLNTSYYTGSYAVADTPDMKKGDSLQTLMSNGILTPNQMCDMSVFLWRCQRDPLSVAHFVKVQRDSEGLFVDIAQHQNVSNAVDNYSLGVYNGSYGGALSGGVSDWQYDNTTGSTQRLGYEVSNSALIPDISPIVECATKYVVLCIKVVYRTVMSRTTEAGGYINFSLASGSTTVDYDTFINDATLRAKLENGQIIVTSMYARFYYGNATSRRYVNVKVFHSMDAKDMECTIWDENTDGVNAVKRKVLLPLSQWATAPAGEYSSNTLLQGATNAMYVSLDSGKNKIIYFTRANPYFWDFGYAGKYSDGCNIIAYVANLRNLALAFSAYYATGFTVTGSTTWAESADLSGDTLPTGGRRGKTDPDTGDINPDDPTDETTGTTDDPTQMHSATGWSGNDHIDPNVYSDETPIETPAITAVGTFNRTYAMSYNQILTLSDELWNADESIFDEIVSGLALLGECPMQGLIDLRLYPFNISTVIGTGTTESIKVGRTTLNAQGVKLGNDVNAVIDLGSCTFFDKFQSFLDYAPYTEARLYIPYCGIVPIDTSEFMGHTITAKMVIDVITGACEAFVYADNIIIIHANGNIGVSIPMTGDNAAAYAAGVLGNIVGGTVDVVSGAASGSIVKTVGGVADVAGGMLGATPTQYAKSGTASSACSMWLPQYCYFIIDRPAPLAPSEYGHCVGFACDETKTIGSYSGYVVCENVDTTGIWGTDRERQMIKEIMESGFYV